MKKLIGTLTLMTTVLASSIASYGAINETEILGFDIYSHDSIIYSESHINPNDMLTFGGRIQQKIIRADGTLPDRKNLAIITGADKNIKAISYEIMEKYSYNVFGFRILKIEAGAFEDCTELEYADLRYCCSNSIGSRAFANCTALRDVYLNSNINIAQDAFEGCDKNKLVFRIEKTTDESYVPPVVEYAIQNGIKYEYYNDIKTFGDVDGDGVVTSADAAMLHQFILNYKNDYNRYYIFDSFYHIDVDGDGRITSSDVANILQKSLDSSYKMPRDR